MASKTCVCGMEIGSDDQFCPYCGREQRAAQATRPLEAEAAPAYGSVSASTPAYEPYPAPLEPTEPSYQESYAGAESDTPTVIPERPLYHPQAVGSSVPSAGAAASPSYGATTYGTETGNGGATWAQMPTQTQTPAQNADGTWASGSSFPAANPYAQQPNTVSSGTTINGRPANSGGGGVLKGVGAGIAAFFVILAKAGAGLGAALGALGSIGIFKFLLYWFAFRWLFHDGYGGVVLLIIIVAIVGGLIWRRQAA